MYRYVILLVITGLVKPSPAQTLPEDWFGDWKGALHIVKPGDKEQEEVQMQLEIKPTDIDSIMKWEIRYVQGMDTTVKAYKLLAEDPQSGRYRIDENNGILLDATLVGECLISTFEVQQKLLTISYCLEQQNLFFQVHVADMGNPSKTGGKVDIPLVTIYPILSMQWSALIKQ